MKSIEESDAQDILNIRFLPHARIIYKETSARVDDQIEWIRSYKVREQQGKDLYFMIQPLDGRASLGTARIYDIENKSFQWGSWIVRRDCPHSVGVEAAMIIYSYAFEVLHLTRGRVEVWNDNVPVLRFHQNCGHVIEWKDDARHSLFITEEVWQNTKVKYRKYLPPLPLQILLS